MSIPRAHHFVPQFWIRNFADASGALWSYDWAADTLKVRSSRQVMQVFNLYTIQPQKADDTTLETVDNSVIDTNGSRVFGDVLSGVLTEQARLNLAEFFSAQILRDPEVILSYTPKAQELALKLVEAFDAQDYQTFCEAWGRLYPGSYATEAEYNHIRSQGLAKSEEAIEKIILALDESGGLPEVPFTDLVRSADSRRIVRDGLLACDWTLLQSPSKEFILGDTGVLYEKKELHNLKAPLSKGVALKLSKANSPRTGIRIEQASNIQVEEINYESAARARRWIVGDKPELERLKSQVQKGSFLSR